MSGDELIARPRSDLGIRTASGVAMLAVAIGAILLGGWFFVAFVVLIGIGVLKEWWGLAEKLAKTPLSAAIWLVAGASYIIIAMAVLVTLQRNGTGQEVMLIAMVIGVDVGAYFAGRALGGPKIAPAISPSKTWAGLFGGMIGAALVAGYFLLPQFDTNDPDVGVSAAVLHAVAAGIGVAIVAQSGDFFESWMKRRAGVKDSGNLIPGHGGLLDRVDGLLAVLFLTGIMMLVGGQLS
jgi:phosphatidate cytidylyltransferase